MAAGIALAALISIVAILFSGWSDPVAKSLGTVATMTVHALIAVVVLNTLQGKDKTSSQIILSSVVLVIVALSFFTSTLMIWEIINFDFGAALAKTYFWAFVTALTCAKILEQKMNSKWSDILAKVTLGITLFLFFYIQPGIYVSLLPKQTVPSSYDPRITREVDQKLPDIYYRGQASLIVALVASGTIMVLVQKMFDGKKTTNNTNNK